MVFDSYVFSAAGGREVNEDAALCRELPDGLLCVVADGLGGHRSGELASAKVTGLFADVPPPEAETDAAAWLRESVEAAGTAVLELQRETGGQMKSTVAALLLRDNGEAAWANVGDTRLYRFHGGEQVFVTEDHSVSYKKFRAGEISRADIRTDPDQSALLRALGNAERCAPDAGSFEAPAGAGDGFLLCSDGVWEYLPEGEMLIDLLKSASAREWGENLLLRVLSRVGPGNDNLSLITVLAREEDTGE